jgi:hypothetical protein
MASARARVAKARQRVRPASTRCCPYGFLAAPVQFLHVNVVAGRRRAGEGQLGSAGGFVDLHAHVRHGNIAARRSLLALARLALARLVRRLLGKHRRLLARVGGWGCSLLHTGALAQLELHRVQAARVRRDANILRQVSAWRSRARASLCTAAHVLRSGHSAFASINRSSRLCRLAACSGAVWARARRSGRRGSSSAVHR